ncbi:MAG: ABC transporter substrate-binding protein [Alphaproteobacteria bacterium]|nr:ABC transporter substrate-binding protein [Alphaproteobacteria bacterium]
MHSLLKVLATASAIGLALPAHAETVRIAELNWAASSAIAQVIKLVIERYIGDTVEIVGGDEAPMYEAIAAGHGDVDATGDFWANLWPAIWSGRIAPGSDESMKVNKNPYMGGEGIFVAGYTQDTHGITDIVQLKDPEIAKLFDTDGDGLGEYWTGAAGWQSVDYNAVKAKSMGFADLWEPVVVEVPVLEGMIDAAFQRQEPILFYYYWPEWIFGAYDLRQLKEPPFTGYSSETLKDSPLYNPDGCYNFISQSEDQEWLEKSSITCAYPEIPVYVLYSATLAERAPKSAQLLDQVTFDREVVNGWIKAISHDGVEAAVVAEEWVNANETMIKEQWLVGIELAH